MRCLGADTGGRPRLELAGAGSGVRCLGADTGGCPRLELAVNGGGFGRAAGGRLALAADGSGLRTEAVLGSADSWGCSGSADS